MGDIASNLVTGFTLAFSWHNLLIAFMGVVVGNAVGVLPGLGTPLTISLLLPLTFGMDPISAFIMFGGIYSGALYGGSITSILLNTPGENASIITAVEGYQMAKQGRAGAALATSALGSFVAGTIGVFLLMVGAPILARFALLFGPAEYFAVMAFALTTVTGFAGKSVPKALFTTIFGLTLGMVGIDSQSGQHRYTFGVPHLSNGIDIVVAAIGLFAITEVISIALERHQMKKSGTEPLMSIKGRVWLTRDEYRRSVFPWLRGAFLGFFIGVLPGAGATVASFLSYDVERRITKRPDLIGKGAIEGVAGPEAANNAAAAGAFVPLLTLGIPGSGTTAVMLAAFQMYGLRPGPLLIQHNGDLVWALIASLYIGNVMLVILNLPMVKLWVKLLDIPSELLYSLVLALSAVGVYATRGSTFDLMIAFGLGIVGVYFRKYDFPIPPVILGLTLGPLMEDEFRRALQMSEGSYAVFVSSWPAVILLSLALISLVAAYRRQIRLGKRNVLKLIGNIKEK